MVGPVRKRKLHTPVLHWRSVFLEITTGKKSQLSVSKGQNMCSRAGTKYKWEHWGLQGKMSRKWQEKNAEGGATIQIPDNCVPKTEQSRNSGIPQDISASVCRSLPSLQSFCSFRSYVIPDPRRPPSIPKTAGSNFTERTLSASTGCRVGIAPLSAAIQLMPGTTWAGDSPLPLLCGCIRSVWVTQSWEYYSSSYCKKRKRKTRVGHTTQKSLKIKHLQKWKKLGQKAAVDRVCFPCCYEMGPMVYPMMRHWGGNSKTEGDRWQKQDGGCMSLFVYLFVPKRKDVNMSRQAQNY